MQQRADLMDDSGHHLRNAAWSVFNAIRVGAIALWTAAWISAALLVVWTSGRRDVALRMAAAGWAPPLLAIAGARVSVEGLERIDPGRTYLFVSNHQSVIDVPVLFSAIPQPLRFLLKREMTRVPFIGWYARACEMLFITRDDRRAGAQMRRDAAAMLRAGRSLCLFPEGTRTRDGSMAPFKAGSVQAAIDAGVPVVPVALHGAGAVLPVHGFLRSRPGPVRVSIGVPIDPAGGDRQALAAAAQAAVAAMLAR